MKRKEKRNKKDLHVRLLFEFKRSPAKEAKNKNKRTSERRKEKRKTSQIEWFHECRKINGCPKWSIAISVIMLFSFLIIFISFPFSATVCGNIQIR